MSTYAILAAAGAALGAAALVVAIYLFINRRRIESERAVQERLGSLAISGQASASSVSILRGQEVGEGVLDRLLSGRSVAGTIEQESREAGLGWTPGQFAGFVLLGLSAGLIAAFFVSRPLAIVIGTLGCLLPFIVLARAKAARLKKIEEQLPDAVDMLVNSLQAGYSLQAGMNFVGSEMPAPLGTEFSRFYDEQRLGMDVRQALQNLTDRLGTLDARMFVLAIIIQRETGGNLSEILGNISTVIRERINFRGHLDVLTAESKMSAIVLAVLPVLLFFVVRYTNPAYVSTLTDTDIGRLMLMYAAASLVVGFFMLRSMSKIEV
ncbi:MAG TPA: type II secretion system F family protein [Gemmatimonas sp.]|nr:type II secretion system F family protein [Gemmatimonas sp.]